MSDKYIARRDFLKSTAAGFSGFFFLAAHEKKRRETVEGKKLAKKSFPSRTLGNTGIRLPVINMRVMNQGCGQCLNHCVQQLPIPELMRAYMYVYGYRNFREGQDLILSLNLPAQLCTDCSQCPVACLNGFNVSDRVRNIVRLREIPVDFIA